MAGLLSKTYDPTVPADFQLELARSGQSTCRNPHCLVSENRKIAKGCLRIARMEASPSDDKKNMKGRVVPKWVHLQCCDPVILQEAVDRYGGSIEHVPGYEALEEENQAAVMRIAKNTLSGDAGDSEEEIEVVPKQKTLPEQKREKVKATKKKATKAKQTKKNSEKAEATKKNATKAKPSKKKNAGA